MKKILAVVLMLFSSSVYAEKVVVIPMFGDEVASSGGYGVYDATDEILGVYMGGQDTVMTVGGSGPRAGELFEIQLVRQGFTWAKGIYYTGQNCTGIPFMDGGSVLHNPVMPRGLVGVDPAGGPWTYNDYDAISESDLKILLMKNPDSTTAMPASQSKVQYGSNSTHLGYICSPDTNMSAGDRFELEIVDDAPSFTPPLTVKTK